MELGIQKFYGHGKLLLTGEYAVMKGARAIALPTNFGQSMQVTYRRCNADPKLFWKSYDHESMQWFEATFELWHFKIIGEENDKAKFLQKILKKARSLNVHFLRDDVDVHVNCHLEFATDWGLGSSSTLIYNIAQWAYISAFELHRLIGEGSGYDVACAQAVGPIYYQLKNSGINWGTIDFNPIFKDNLFFVHLNQKQGSIAEVQRFLAREEDVSESMVQKISKISDKIVGCIDLQEFENYLLDHELIIKSITGNQRCQDLHFKDYPGVIKSLGAWGGDFILATSDMGEDATRDYFKNRGYNTFLTYEQMIYQKDILSSSYMPSINADTKTHESIS